MIIIIKEYEMTQANISDVLSHAISGDSVALQSAVDDVIQAKADDILSQRFDEIEQEILGDGVEDDIVIDEVEDDIDLDVEDDDE